MWQIRGVLLWLVALSEAAIRHQPSPPPSLFCCAVHVVSCVRRVARLERAARKKNEDLLVIWSKPDFGFDCVSSSLAEFMSIFFFQLFFSTFFLYMYATQTPQTQQTAHEQCRVRATTSSLQRYTRLPPASEAGSNTTRVR